MSKVKPFIFSLDHNHHQGLCVHFFKCIYYQDGLKKVTTIKLHDDDENCALKCSYITPLQR